mmetsp:Transcript_7813/g.24452  ORF Transcript_7813/g.24452 Transcript_7813/m.24452 type:complete len:315 (-) Transcript_7813:104-1048(-)
MRGRRLDEELARQELLILEPLRPREVTVAAVAQAAGILQRGAHLRHHLLKCGRLDELPLAIEVGHSPAAVLVACTGVRVKLGAIVHPHQILRRVKGDLLAVGALQGFAGRRGVKESSRARHAQPLSTLAHVQNHGRLAWSAACEAGAPDGFVSCPVGIQALGSDGRQPFRWRLAPVCLLKRDEELVDDIVLHPKDAAVPFRTGFGRAAREYSPPDFVVAVQDVQSLEPPAAFERSTTAGCARQTGWRPVRVPIAYPDEAAACVERRLRRRELRRRVQSVIREDRVLLVESDEEAGVPDVADLLHEATRHGADVQ